EAPITTVGEPRRLNSAYTPRTNLTPGSSSMLAGAWPWATYQSRMRPTNGEIRNAPASEQASAWVGLKISVRLQSMPSACSTRVASTPAQVAAILISTLSRGTPAAAYMAMNWRALAMVAAVSW